MIYKQINSMKLYNRLLSCLYVFKLNIIDYTVKPHLTTTSLLRPLWSSPLVILIERLYMYIFGHIIRICIFKIIQVQLFWKSIFLWFANYLKTHQTD